ncbi:hypothetical protein [Mycobacterium interjectum]|uniref:hypothetical protein n=1 Tax=Mycobacterium interjectum TaxID=33895 RepID=UPI00082D3523|nr:hypothetical protein [Mycobacterium interjectum]MCV7088886.1 hypothetical protein [Mycobacterium interjectum]
MPNAPALMAKAGTNKYMRKALTSWPDYERLVALRASVFEHQRTLAPIPEIPPPAHAETDLDAWLADVAHAANAQRDREVKRGALGDLLRDIDSEIVAIAEVHTETLLKSLAADLDDLMGHVADVVSRLHGATTPTAAIANGTADAWRELPPLREEYDDLRDAQLTVMHAADVVHIQSAQSPHLDDEMATDLAIANLDDVLPGWRGRAPAHVVISGSPPDRRPWPTDPIEQLVWLLSSTAKPWVPTLAQLYRLNEDRRKRANPTPNPTPKPLPRWQAPTALNTPIPKLTAKEGITA